MQYADDGIHCYSSANLISWLDEEIVVIDDYLDDQCCLAYSRIPEKPKVVFNDKSKLFVAYYKI